MLVPYSVDVPHERWPIANWCIIAVTIAVSVAVLLTPEPQHLLGYRLGADPWWQAGVLSRADFSPVQLLTHAFLHGGWLHLFGNMLFLFCFGNAVNAKLGHALYVLAYAALGALTGAAWLAFGDGPGAIGASGAIMGVIGLYLIYFPRNDVRIFYCIGLGLLGGFRTGVFEMSSYWLIVFYVLGDVFGLWAGGGQVAYVAHLFGMLGGVLAGASLVYVGLIRSTDTEQNLLQLLGVRTRGD